MSRNMILANQSFFANIIGALNNVQAEYIEKCTRYIATDDTEKSWLKQAKIERACRFSKTTCALLVKYIDYYICTVNVNIIEQKVVGLALEPVNSGLATLLGAEGYLTKEFSVDTQTEIYERVLYDTSQVEYTGHNWTDIKGLFPPISCFHVEGKDSISRNEFYELLCRLAFENKMCNNPMGKISEDIWEKIFYESDKEINFNNLLLAYTALSWDLTYLYLYQCLEDRFAEESVKELKEKLGITLSEKELSGILYDKLEWQPRDLESIDKIIKKFSQSSTALKLLEESAMKESVPKFIYAVRNGIVHETREPLIPLGNNERWEKLIAGMLLLIKES